MIGRAVLFLKIGRRGKSEKETWTEPTQKEMIQYSVTRSREKSK
jgi:hypothetical protein